MSKDSKLRSALKSASYIVIHEIGLLIVTYLFTKDLAMSAGIVLVSTLLEGIYYYVHERVWTKIEIKK